MIKPSPSISTRLASATFTPPNVVLVAATKEIVARFSSVSYAKLSPSLTPIAGSMKIASRILSVETSIVKVSLEMEVSVLAPPVNVNVSVVVPAVVDPESASNVSHKFCRPPPPPPTNEIVNVLPEIAVSILEPPPSMANESVSEAAVKVPESAVMMLKAFWFASASVDNASTFVLYADVKFSSD